MRISRSQDPDILKRLDAGCENVRDTLADPTGPVAAGLPQSMAKLVTLPLVTATLERWPKIELQVIEMSTGYIPTIY